MSARAHTTRLRLARVARTLALAGALACSPVLFDLGDDGRPPARYELTAPKRDQPCSPQSEMATLVIERPSVRESIDGTRIAARFPTGEIRYLAEVRWASPLADMLHHMLVESFESACLHAVRQTPGLADSPALSTELARFHAVGDPDGLQSVRIDLRVRLLGGSPLGIDTTRVSASAPIANSDVESAIAAFDVALAEILRETRSWAAAAMRVAPPSLPVDEKRR